MAELTRPPTLRTFLDDGCDVGLIPDLDQYARVIVIGHHEPAPGCERFARAMRKTAEAWLRGEDATLVDGVDQVATPGLLRQYQWLSEGLTDSGVAERLEEALPEPVRAVCWERIDEIRASR